MSDTITAEQHAALNADGQGVRLFAAIWQPTTVFACQVNGAPSSNGSVMQLTYDGVTTGAYTDVLEDMTVWVGTSAGAHDKGFCRVRAAATDTILYIGETSEINFADNDYLTVKRDFDLFPRHIRKYSAGWRVDGVTYSNQHSVCAPIANLGPIAAVLDMEAGIDSFSPDASGSWVPGSTIASYAHTATGASATANLTTDTPTLTYATAGQYVRSCVVTAANGATTTAYRYVFVFDADNPPMEVEMTSEAVCSAEDGGASFGLKTSNTTDIDAIDDRALVVLFSRDQPAAIGPVAGHANIIAWGRIIGESIEKSAEDGTVEFEVQGPHYWLKQVPSFPVGLKDTTSAPTKWIFYQGLTVDAALWHFWHWRSTAYRTLDLYPTGDTKRISATEAALGGLWAQISAVANTVLAKPLCDFLGRCYVEVPPNLVPVADRTSIQTMMTLTEADWHDTLRIRRGTATKVAGVELSGVSWNGTKGTPYFSKAPGSVMAWHGEPPMSVENVAVDDQDDCNSLCGLKMGAENPEYRIELDLAQNNRFIDTCPRQYIALSETTARGTVALNAIPVRVTRKFESGAPTVGLEMESETQPHQSMTYIPSKPKNETYEPEEPGLPTIDPIIPPSNPYFPPTVDPGDGGASDDPPPTSDCIDNTAAPANGPYGIGMPYWEVYSYGDTRVSSGPLPCYVRSQDHDNKTTFRLSGKFSKWDGTIQGFIPMETADLSGLFTLKVYNGASLLGTVGMSGGLDFEGNGELEGVFSLPASARMTHVVLTMAEGDGHGYIYGDPIYTGTCDSNDLDGVSMFIPDYGSIYALEAWGGPWHSHTTELPGYAFTMTKEYPAANFSGNFGLNQEPTRWLLDLGSYAIFAEDATGEQKYGRAYFKGNSLAVTFRANTNERTDNVGSLGYKLYHAGVFGDYRISSLTISVYNICGLG